MIEWVLKCILLNANDTIALQISLKLGPIDNKPALVQAPNRRQAITWTDDDLVNWRIYAALGEMGFNYSKARTMCVFLWRYSLHE